jgi:hypothetical protein
VEIILERFYERLVHGDAIAPLQSQYFHVLTPYGDRLRHEPNWNSILAYGRSEVVSLRRPFTSTGAHRSVAAATTWALGEEPNRWRNLVRKACSR